MRSEFLLFVLVLVALALFLSMRVCRESERVALNTPRRFVKLIGPGLFLRLPMQLGRYEYTYVRIGDRGCYMGSGWGKVDGKDVPVRAVSDLDIDEAFEVKGFDKQEILAEAVGK